MNFPETRLSLIERLAQGGSEEDWQRFLRDYWGPVCRFSLRAGAGRLSDAEDVAGQTFQVLWENRLLVRWVSHRGARLRSLICGVTRKIIANRVRVRQGRERLAEDAAQQWAQPLAIDDEQAELFYAAWVEDLLRQALDSVAARYYREAKGDYVRVLYSRVCRQASFAVMADELGTNLSTINNYFRHARQRLTDAFESLLRRQVEQYSEPDGLEQEFQEEWRKLGSYLAEHGGVEEAVRRAYELMDPAASRANQRAARQTASRAARAADRSDKDRERIQQPN